MIGWVGRHRVRLAILGLGAVAIVSVALVFGLSGGPTGPPTPSAEWQEFYDAGVAKLKPGLFEEAVPALATAAEIDPRQTMGHYQLALAYFNAGLPRAALGAINVVLEHPEHVRFAERSPTYHLLFELRADIYSNLGEYEKSKWDYEKVLLLAPDADPFYLGKIHYYLCWTHLTLNDLEPSLEAGRRALELGYQTYESTFKLGMTYKRLKRLEEAEQSFRDSISMNPGYTKAYVNLAEVLLKRGKREEGTRLHKMSRRMARANDVTAAARTRIDQLRVTDPRYRSEMENYMALCRENWDFPELVGAMEKLIVLDPDNAEYHFQMACARAQLREYPLAEEHFRRAIDLHKDMVSAMNGLSFLLARAQDPSVRRPAEALIWAEEARKGGYKGVEILAEALRANGRTEEALRLVEEGLEAGNGPASLGEIQSESFRNELRDKEIGDPARVEKP
ncbi:MAG: tetratricopeptide repeat protein [Planctomycetota bacterium]|nr:tetratricopeptide repeat protein [Planctomycetota bacterium]